MDKSLMIALSGLCVSISGMAEGADDWIQGVWNCQGYQSTPMMQCQTQGQIRYAGDQYDYQAAIECTAGSMQASTWGTYSLKGKGDLWSLTFKPTGSVPPQKKYQPITETIQINPDRSMYTSRVSYRTQDGGQSTTEGRCQRVQ